MSVPSTHGHSAIGTVQTLRPAGSQPVQRKELMRLFARLQRVTGQTLARSADRASQLELIETKLSRIAIDGNIVTNPIGFQGAKLEAWAIGLAVTRAFEAEIAKLATYLKLEAALVPTAWAIAAAMPAEDTMGLVLESQHSTLFRLQHDIVMAMERCPYGSEQLRRDIAASLGLPRHRSDTRLKAWDQDTLEPAERTWLREAMRYGAQQWWRALDPALARLREQGELAARLCYCHVTPGLPDIIPLLRAWAATWSMEISPTVHEVESIHIPEVSDRTGALGRDPADLITVAMTRYAGQGQRPLAPIAEMFSQAAPSGSASIM